MAKAHDVRGFPSVRIYRDGATEASEEYEGPRVAGGIVTELERLAAPATEPLATRADVRAFVARAPVVFVGAFAEGDEEAAAAGAFDAPPADSPPRPATTRARHPARHRRDARPPSRIRQGEPGTL